MKHYFIVFIIVSTAFCGKASEIVEEEHKTSSVEECPVSKEDAIDSLQQLYSVGYPDYKYPKDDCDILEHCDYVEENAERVLAHFKCVKQLPLKVFFTQMARGYLQANQKRCSNKEWRKKFLRLSKCLKTGGGDINQCGYKLYDAFNYTLAKFNADQQLQFACCANLMMRNCVHSEILNVCGDEDIAKYGTEFFFEPMRMAISFGCGYIESVQQCTKLYPEDYKVVEKIFSSKIKLTPGNLMIPGYEFWKNRGQKLPQLTPV